MSLVSWSGAVAKGSYHTPEVRAGGREEQPHTQGVAAAGMQEGWRKEIPLIQGKEQQLCFAGAAMKRYPTSKVRETQVRR